MRLHNLKHQSYTDEIQGRRLTGGL